MDPRIGEVSRISSTRRIDDFPYALTAYKVHSDALAAVEHILKC